MHLRRVLWMGLVGLVLATGAWTAAQDAGVDPRAPVYTRQRTFVIPFRVEPTEISLPDAAEVQLHVSSDQGITWNRSAQAAPTAGRFSFDAPRDGEYWFFVRTLGGDGALYPVSPPEAELVVVVDTLLPRLDLEAARGAGGEVTARWLVRDRNLNRDSLKIEYRAADSQAPWQTVTLQHDGAAGALARVDRGATTWYPEGSPGPLAIRAEATDLAGNVAVTQVRLDQGGASTANSTLDEDGAEEIPPPGAEGIVRNSAAQDGRQMWQAEELPLPPFVRSDANRSTAPPAMSDRFPGRDDPYAASRRASGAPMVDSSSPLPEPLPPGRPAEGEDAAPPARVVNLPDRDERYRREPVGADANTVEEIPPGVAAPPRRSQPVTTSRDESLAPFDAQPPSVAPGAGVESGLPFGLEMLPIGQRPDIVNSRRFELEYEVESVGPSGIAKVELWGTRDGGRTWSSYGVDVDNKSPLVVAVDGEGIYGFRIAVTSGSGLGGLAPRSGDLPEVWIGVDVTKPIARLAPIQHEDDDRAGELTISWKASDVMLAEHPISLFYGEVADGPWTPIATGLDNSGRHVWRLANNLPAKVYVRLEVRDAAGNVAVAVSDAPISLDQMRPQGHIRTIRPLDEVRAE